jgi:hypothetical protein
VVGRGVALWVAEPITQIVVRPPRRVGRGVDTGVVDQVAHVRVGVAQPVVEVRRSAGGREGREGGGEAEGGEDVPCDVEIRDEGQDSAAPAAGAGKNILGEDSLEQVSPWQAGLGRARWRGRGGSGRRGGVGRLTGRQDAVGEVHGREGDDPGAAPCARGEHAGVSNEMTTGRWQDAGEAAEEGDGGQFKMRATVRPRLLQSIRHLPARSHREAVAGERGPAAVPA